MPTIKVLIVDDSALVRQAFTKILNSETDIEVIGTASDPYIAVNKIQKQKPDVITLDIEMPRMDGLTFLKKIMKQAPMPVIVVSNQTLKGAKVALKALELGAVEVLTKPNLSNQQHILESSIRLTDAIRSAYTTKRAKISVKAATIDTANKKKVKTISTPVHLGTKANLSKVIVIGASTGGTEAIKSFLEALPTKMPPILIVQHMPEKFTHSFATRLNDNCQLTVKEAEQGDLVQANHVYIAPGNHHMKVKSNMGQLVIAIEQGEFVNRHRPSVDVLFESVAEERGKNTVAIIMTGMGNDGAKGMLTLFHKKAQTIAQDEASSIVYGMPKQALLLGGVKNVLPLKDMAKEVYELVKSS